MSEHRPGRSSPRMSPTMRNRPFRCDHSFQALNVATIRKMVTALNAGVALPLGVPRPFWQQVAISMATDNGSIESWDQKIDGPVCARGRRAKAARHGRVGLNYTISTLERR
jgi:hypothetical protein